MEIKQLEAFVSVVNEKSFSRAAKKLSVTQPAVSSQVAALEKELGTRLIERSTKKLQITVSGCRLYDYAVNILRTRDDIYREFVETDKKIISLGASTIPSAYILPDVLSAYGRSNPDIYFSSSLAPSGEIFEQVRRGTVEFGLTGVHSDDEDLIFTPFLEDRLVLAAPVSRHYLQMSREGANIQDFLNEPFILRKKDSSARKGMEIVLEDYGIFEDQLNVVARMNDLEAVKRSIVRGLGISALPYMAVRDLHQSKQILIFPVGPRHEKRTYYIVTHAGTAMSRETERFLQFLKNYYL